MKIYFTLEASSEVTNKIQVIFRCEDKIDDFFKDRGYSENLDYLYIGLFCMSPKFEPFFAPRRPKYTRETRNYIHRGVPLQKMAKTFEYEIRLDFKLYEQTDDVKPRLVEDIINSLDVLSSSRHLKDVDLEAFKRDFRQIFKELAWLQ